MDKNNLIRYKEALGEGAALLYRNTVDIGSERPRTSQSHSEEVRLLHDAQELLLVDLTIAIAVCLVDHLLQLLVGHALAKLLRHALEVLERDLPGLVVIEEAEGL